MDWTLLGGLIGIGALIVAMTGVLITALIYGMNRMENDIKRVDTSIETLSRRMEAFDRRMDSHAVRIDQIYRTILDLVEKKA